MRVIIILLFLFVFFYKTKAQKSREAFIVLSQKVYDTSTRKYIMPPFYFDNKTWIYKNYSIREVRSYEYREDSLGKVVKNERVLIKYTFIDVKNRLFYEYPPSFSKKSTFFKSYTPNDTMIERFGGYIFWSSNDSTNQIKIPRTNYASMSDTTINGVLFKREYCFHSKHFEGKSYPAQWVLYYRYDIESSIVHLDINFDQQNKLPVVMIEVIEPQTRQKMEISYERLKLTRKERQVFKAWIRNARKQQSLESGYVP
jgi:hypothetical protein